MNNNENIDKFKEEINLIESSESITLKKMSKGYQWDIKVRNKKLAQTDLDRLNEIEEKVREKYGDSDKDI